MKTDAEKTIGSLRKVNDFPLYVARYHGDYKINDFAKGAVKGPSDVVSFFESLFSELGKPVKLSFPSPTDVSPGCSAFFCRSYDDRPIIGKNCDWKQDPVLLLKTAPRKGYASLSMVNLNFCDLFQLGSMEYNLLLSPYVPLDGMNERGLIVLTLSVQEGAEYPEKPDSLSVGDFNLVRIILDSCADIDEALAVVDRYNIMRTGPLPVHILLADKKEACAVEFFEGKMHVKRDRNISYMTNFLTLESSGRDGSGYLCERYRTLERRLGKGRRINGTQEAKNILGDVSVYTEGFQLPSTIYSVVYSPDDLSLKIRIGNKSSYYSMTLPVTE